MRCWNYVFRINDVKIVMRWPQNHLEATLRSHIPSICKLWMLWVLSKMFCPIQNALYQTILSSLIHLCFTGQKPPFDKEGPNSMVTIPFLVLISIVNLCAKWKMNIQRITSLIVLTQAFTSKCLKMSANFEKMFIFPYLTCIRYIKYIFLYFRFGLQLYPGQWPFDYFSFRCLWIWCGLATDIKTWVSKQTNQSSDTGYFQGANQRKYQSNHLPITLLEAAQFVSTTKNKQPSPTNIVHALGLQLNWDYHIITHINPGYITPWNHLRCCRLCHVFFQWKFIHFICFVPNIFKIYHSDHPFLKVRQ